MIDVSRLTYRVYAVLGDGTQLNITGAVDSLAWNEGEGELSLRTMVTLANSKFQNKRLSTVITPATMLVVTADHGQGEKEVARGSVVDWQPTKSGAADSFQLTAYDDLYNMQQSQDDRYIPAGTGTKSAITALFDDWGIPVGEYKGPDVVHAKTVYQNQYLSDIAIALLNDAESHGAEHYVIRAAAGAVSVLPIGSNEDVYHFTERNGTVTSDHITTENLVTRVKVLGLADSDDKRAVEAIVDGRTEFGIRQRIYARSQDDTLESAKTAAQTMIDEHGEPERTSQVDLPDVPYVRKGDKISLDMEQLSGTFLVRSIDHDASSRSMTLTVEPFEEAEEQAEEAAEEAEDAPQTDFKPGDAVYFSGGSHYVSSYGNQGYDGVAPGPATVLYTNPGSDHPWCIRSTDWSKTIVCGWVDTGTITHQ